MWLVVGYSSYLNASKLDSGPCHQINIPQLNAAEAIGQLAKKTGAKLLFPFDPAKARQANAVKGCYSTEKALQLLLEGSGLTSGLSKKGVLTVFLSTKGSSTIREESTEMQQSKKNILAALIGFFAASGGNQAALAQAQANAENSQNEVTLEEIVVVATYRQSLMNAIEQKRNADTVIEAISMEDIGVLPGKSIAESLASIPGIAGARTDDGNIGQLSIRGAQDLALATLNGREQVTVGNARTVDYALYPSTVVSQVQVHKTAKASLAEGGLTGVVNMDTLKPLDFDEQRIVFAAEGTITEVADDIEFGDPEGGRTSLTYIDQLSDDLGVVIAAAHANETIARDGSLSPFDWGLYRSGTGDAGFDLDGDGQGGDEHIPFGFETRQLGGEEKRSSIFLALQWNPSDQLEGNIDLLFSSKDIDSEAQNTMYAGTTWLAPGAYTDTDFVGDDLAAATLNIGANGNAVQATGQRIAIEDEVISTGANIQWNGDLWTLSGDIAYSKAESTRQFDNFTLRMTEPDSRIFNYRAYGDNPSLSVSGFDVTDPANWTPTGWQSLARIGEFVEDELTAVRFDVVRDLDLGTEALKFHTFKAGLRYSEREKVFDKLSTANSFVVSGFQWHPNFDPTLDISPLDSSFVDSIASPSNGPDFIVWDFDQIAERLGGFVKTPSVSGRNDELVASWAVEEDTESFYLQADFAGEGLLPYRGNIGLRYVSTDSRSPGWVDLGDGNPAVPTTADHSYSEVLPSINLSLELSDTQVLRLGWATVLSRPNIDDMRSSARVSLNTLANRLEGSGGTPELDPTIADQSTISYEWYPEDGTSLVLAAHYSDLESFVAEFTNQTTINGQTAQVSGVGNGEGGYIRGLEVALLMNFDDLPAPFNGLGLSANYAYTETNVDPSGDNTFGLTGLSKDVGNAALWWAGEKIEARVGVDYRSEYTDIDDFGNFLTIKDVTTVSTNFAYNFNKDLRVNFFVSNLTDEERSKYTGGVPQRTSFTSSYGRILGLGVHYTM